MQAYYEIEAEIPLDHQLILQLPDNIPVGHAKIVVIYEMPKVLESKADKLAAFLQTLPNEVQNDGLSRDAINEYLQHERQGWD